MAFALTATGSACSLSFERSSGIVWTTYVGPGGGLMGLCRELRGRERTCYVLLFCLLV